ncbi:MAG: isoprenylcysteine carboxylmethyltransferase family protein [Anaerolineaceae bacterium]|nr:isoprenylcysteine carboxylmethyltransferase family protein [Anaerolineaceae bacterium]MBN2677764.1 isoprenylcysteine carboxylmethyltransferase family protein [Anaerolineaceae bacterium]
MTNSTAMVPAEKKGSKLGSILLGLMSLIGLPASLFISAGRWDWREGWIYVAATLLGTIGSRIMVIVKNPDLAKERSQSISAGDAKTWDKWIMSYAAVFGPLLVFVVAGLDERYGWQPDIPRWLLWVGIATILAAIAFSTWAMLENRFFSGTVRIQKERGHQVVSTGPYHLMRHPGYLSGVVGYLAMPLILGSSWAYIPVFIGILITCLRTYLEDRTLQEELPGYREYTQKTKYRLIPGIW